MDKLEEANSRLLRKREELVNTQDWKSKPSILNLTIKELQAKFEARSKNTKIPQPTEATCWHCFACGKICEKVDLSNDLLGEKGEKTYCISCAESKRLSEIDYIYQRAGIPEMYRKASLQEEARSLFFTGANGVGKTYKAAGIICNYIEKLNYIQRKNCNENYPIFITVPELLMKIRNCFSLQQCEESVVEKYSRCPILVLDDLGVEKTTEWALQTLYIILNNRYSNYMQTIITSNLTIEALQDKLGDRIASRIVGMCKMVKLTGRDRRLQSI